MKLQIKKFKKKEQTKTISRREEKRTVQHMFGLNHRVHHYHHRRFHAGNVFISVKTYSEYPCIWTECLWRDDM